MKRSSSRVFQITEGLSEGLGGTAVAVSHLSNYLAGHGFEVSIFGFRGTIEKERPVPLDSRICLKEYPTGRYGRLGFSKPIYQAFRTADLPDLVHLHGLWRLYHAQVARCAAKFGIPLVISTHGMLEPWALNRGRRVKQLARKLYQDRILRTAKCLHATAPEEAETLRRLGFRNPIAIVPWGVEVPPGKRQDQGPGGVTLSIPKGKRAALFLSRIHSIKGLDLLLPAWANVRHRFPEWVLVVAGEGETSYRAELKKLVERLEIEDCVFFPGPVYGENKEGIFSMAELFVLPSRSENFGLAVAEALARGVPVITTKNTPWSRMVEWGCGWWIDLGIDPLTRTLEEALKKTPRELAVMGEIGKARAKKHFSLEASGNAMMEMYRWVLGERSKPDFVRES